MPHGRQLEVSSPTEQSQHSQKCWLGCGHAGMQLEVRSLLRWQPVTDLNSSSAIACGRWI